MTSSILSTAIADYRNRARNSNYAVTLMIMAILTLFFFPLTDASYQTLEINGYRGIYNSAWMGAALSMLNVLFLPLICFYLIKNAINSDRESNLSELIAATSVSKTQYILGKWLSNLGLLSGIVLTMTTMTVFVQLWIGEDRTIDLLALILPQLIFVMPIMMLCAAIAILFETIPVLRRGLGNFIYFFLWVGLIVQTIQSSSGVGTIMTQMENDILVFAPDSENKTQLGISIADERSPLKTFVWQGIDYGTSILTGIAALAIISALLLLFAIVLFDRFAKPINQQTKHKKVGRISRLLLRISTPLNTFIDNISQPWIFTRLIKLEFYLLLKGLPTWYFVLLIIANLVQLFVPFSVLTSVIVPVSLLLPVLIVSPLGTKERINNVEHIIFSCPSPIKKQLPAMFIAAIIVLLMPVIGAFIRLGLTGEVFSAGMLIIAVLFIASLALLCGIWTKTSRTFEILFITLWYIGPLQSTPYLDFIGTNPVNSSNINAPLWFGALIGLQIVLIYLGRAKQIRFG